MRRGAGIVIQPYKTENNRGDEMKRAKRMNYFRPSVFTQLEEEKKKQQEQGREMIDFYIGSPDLAPAPHIIRS